MSSVEVYNVNLAIRVPTNPKDTTQFAETSASPETGDSEGDNRQTLGPQLAPLNKLNPIFVDN